MDTASLSSSRVKQSQSSVSTVGGETRSKQGTGERSGKRAAVTLGFLGFCGSAVAGMLYLVQQFQNGSYRAMVVFLVVISISNVSSKYMIWMAQRSEPV